MRISEEMLKKAALAIRQTKEFQVGAAFGVATTAHEAYSAVLAEAAPARRWPPRVQCRVYFWVRREIS